MLSSARRITLLYLVGLSLFGCSSTSSPNDQGTDANSQNNFNTDIEEDKKDIREDSEDNHITEDINEGGDADAEEELNPGFQNVQLKTLEGMIQFSWVLPDDDTLTHIRITASPSALIWGEAERVIELPATDYLFDKLVNEIQYTFEIQALYDDEEVGDPVILHATPFSRPLLGVITPSTSIFDSLTKQSALGWEGLMEYNALPLSWSPDGTKLLTIINNNGRARCALFDRASRKEIQLLPSDEFGHLCRFSHAWSPDSRHLAITHIQNIESQRLTYSVINTQTGDIVPDWPDLFETYPGLSNISSLNWSPDGDRLAASLSFSDGPSELIIINTITKEIELDWPVYPDLDLGSYSIPDVEWSPDSKYLGIAYSPNNYSGQEAGYLILNTETKEIESGWPDNITPHPNRIIWSPDGALLILTFSYSPGASIEVINTDTRENELGWPTDWPRVTDVGWSHDSQFLAIGSYTSPYLLVYDRDSKEMDAGWAPLSAEARGLFWSPQHAPPIAPSAVELVRAGGENASLSWNTPDDTTILDYRITIEPAEQVDGPADYLLFDPSATEHVVNGLNPQVDYTISVRAINVFGVGEPAIFSTL